VVDNAAMGTVRTLHDPRSRPRSATVSKKATKAPKVNLSWNEVTKVMIAFVGPVGQVLTLPTAVPGWTYSP
jgi:hypothetical protein